MQEDAKTPRAPQFIGDDLALDFINSEFGVGAAHHDCFADDEAVLAWLKLAGVLPDDVGVAPKGLQALAVRLRDNARSLVHAAKQEEGASDATVVNQVLQAGRAAEALHEKDARLAEPVGEGTEPGRTDGVAHRQRSRADAGVGVGVGRRRDEQQRAELRHGQWQARDERDDDVPTAREPEQP